MRWNSRCLLTLWTLPFDAVSSAVVGPKVKVGWVCHAVEKAGVRCEQHATLIYFLCACACGWVGTAKGHHRTSIKKRVAKNLNLSVQGRRPMKKEYKSNYVVDHEKSERRERRVSRHLRRIFWWASGINSLSQCNVAQYLHESRCVRQSASSGSSEHRPYFE